MQEEVRIVNDMTQVSKLFFNGTSKVVTTFKNITKCDIFNSWLQLKFNR